MYTVKLRNLTNDITEDDIFSVMKRFGEIVKVKIPFEELRNGKTRSRGFAFVTYTTTEEADRALEQREVNIDIVTSEIERAMKRVMQPRDNPKAQELDTLKRFVKKY